MQNFITQQIILSNWNHLYVAQGYKINVKVLKWYAKYKFCNKLKARLKKIRGQQLPAWTLTLNHPQCIRNTAALVPVCLLVDKN